VSGKPLGSTAARSPPSIAAKAATELANTIGVSSPAAAAAANIATVSGIQLPAISLGLWQNFGDDRPLAGSRAILRRAFDLGITHFDLANNYGPPYGAAETNFGRIFAEDFCDPTATS
jgi:hypothetical protein